MPIDFTVETADITQIPSDLLVLKYAQNFYGADDEVATLLSDHGVCSKNDLRPRPGDIKLVETRGVIAAARVLFIGVPSLSQFRYKQMRNFARQAIKTAAEIGRPVRTISMTVHGAGYGLDIEESLQAQVFGLQLGLAEHTVPQLGRIVFGEVHPRRAATLETTLRSLRPVYRTAPADDTATAVQTPAPPVKPPPPPEKKSVFVAMPFSEPFEDVYEFGIYAPIRRCGYVCERVDEVAFAGDLVSRIQEGIRCASFVVADLTAERPNVYLEVGYAWGLNKPVLLLAREGEKLHFDLSHHKCIFYRTIGKLAADLERVVRDMYGIGTDPPTTPKPDPK